ncbi:MAG: sugar nucleotide-binding protein [Polyangiales bacterium]
MRLLITGGTGLLGSALVARALAAGHRVAATHLARPPGDPRASWSRLDVTDAAAVARAVADVDAVVHTAYAFTGDAMRAVTADGAARVAAAARAAGARLVHLSTDVVFDGEREGPYTEDDPPSPVTPYGRAKADAETMVFEAHPGAAVVRTSLLYTLAPDDRQARLALDLAEGRAAGALFTDEIRCPSLADDVAGALVELAALPFAGVLHVAGAEALSRHAFASRLLRARGVDPARLPAARSADQPVRRPRNCALDGARARSLLAARVRGVGEVLG